MLVALLSSLLCSCYPPPRVFSVPPPHPHPLFMALSPGILQSVTPGNFGAGGIVKDCVISLSKAHFHVMAQVCTALPL